MLMLMGFRVLGEGLGLVHTKDVLQMAISLLGAGIYAGAFQQDKTFGLLN